MASRHQVMIDGRKLTVSNLDKLFFLPAGLRKQRSSHSPAFLFSSTVGYGSWPRSSFTIGNFTILGLASAADGSAVAGTVAFSCVQ